MVLAVALVALVVVLVVKPLVSLRCFVLLGAALGFLFSPRCFTFIILARFQRVRSVCGEPSGDMFEQLDRKNGTQWAKIQEVKKH